MSDILDLSGFRHEVLQLAGRVEDLQTRVHGADSPAPALVDEVVTELQTTAEELRVSYEELSAQSEALVESRKRLGEEHAKYRLLFLGAPVAYVVTDLRGVVQDANQAAIDLFNVDPRFLHGKPLVSFISTPHRPAARQLMLQVGATGRRARAEWDIQPRRRPPLPAAVDIGAQHHLGVPECLLWLLRDLSSERSLRQRAGELQERLAGQGRGADERPLIQADVAVAEFSAQVLDELSLSALLQSVAEHARELVENCVGASVSVLEQGRPREGAATAAWVKELDDRQFAVDEGPALDVLASGEHVASPGLTEERRWPQWTADATAQGINSVLAVPLRVRGAVLGALVLVGTSGNSFSEAEVGAVRRFSQGVAATIANGMLVEANRRLAAELEQALVSRSTIDMAKGVLIARLGLDPDGAFEALRTLSQQRHMKVRDLAALLLHERKQ